MAVTSGSITKLALNAMSTLTLTAVTTLSDGITFPMEGDCQRMLLVLAETGGSNRVTFTLTGGNGVQKGAALTKTVTAGAQEVVVIESGRFVQMSGTNKGKILITGSGSGTGKAALLKLPQSLSF